MIRSNRLRTAALGLGMALVLAACGAESGDSAQVSPAVSPASAFEGEFTSLAGNSVDLGSLEGQDVVLWLWAPW